MSGAIEQRSGASSEPKANWLQTIGFGVAAVLVLGALLVAIWPRPTAEAVFDEARAAFEARDFPRADSRMKQLGSLRSPTDIDWMLRAQVALGLNRTDEAFEALGHVPDQNPMAAAAQLELGQMELRRHRFIPAEAHFLHALKLDPQRIQARRELVYIYGTQLRRPELNATFRALSDQTALGFPEIFLWCLARGVTWEPEEIVRTLTQAIEADPIDRWARLGLASSLLGLSRFNDAEATLALLPAIDPDARAIRVRLALARGEDQLVETLLTDGPEDHAELALLRGQMALARGDASATLHHYRIAYKKAPHLREAVFGLGKALQLNRDPAAATYLDQATKIDLLNSLIQKAGIEVNRKDAQLVRDLGAACATVGRLAEARAWYQLAIARDPLDTKANAALARLADPEPSETVMPR